MSSKKKAPAKAAKSATLTPEASTDFAAEMTQAQVLEADARWSGSGDIAVARRATLFVLARSKEQLVSAAADISNDGFLALLDLASEFIDTLESTLKIARAVKCRLLVAAQAAMEGEGAPPNSTTGGV